MKMAFHIRSCMSGRGHSCIELLSGYVLVPTDAGSRPCVTKARQIVTQEQWEAIIPSAHSEYSILLF